MTLPGTPRNRVKWSELSTEADHRAVTSGESRGRSPPRTNPPPTNRFLRVSSFFGVQSPLDNATKQQSKINFEMQQVSVTWSLERVLMELQILSILLFNTVAALRRTSGAEPGTVLVTKITNEAEFWEAYAQSASCDVPTASLKHTIDAKHVPLLTDKQVFDSYRKKTSLSDISI